jgi:hypothetical protein
MRYLSPVWLASIWSGVFEVTAFVALYSLYRFTGEKFNSGVRIFFNPEDYAASLKRSNGSKELPASSSKATFEPFLTQYTGMAKVIIGLAAASISFGGLKSSNLTIYTAKMLLAYSIAFALFFCITVINFYENYLHDLNSYGPFKCALVESSGLSSLFCFALGYGYWAWHL